MATLSTDQFSNLKNQAASLLQDVVEQATNRALAETRGKRQSRGFGIASRGNSAPSARDIALNAASGAIELWQAARDRAEGTIDTVQSTVTDSASELKDGALGIKSDAVDAARAVSASIGDTAHRAADGSKSAAVASAKAGKNTAGLFFWTAAAGAVVYLAFLDEERREQAKHLAMRAIDEGRAILADLRGEDGEFA
jgi:hypothetical protein